MLTFYFYEVVFFYTIFETLCTVSSGICSCLLSFFKYLWSDYFLLDRNGDTDNTVNRRQMGSPHHRTQVLWGEINNNE